MYWHTYILHNTAHSYVLVKCRVWSIPQNRLRITPSVVRVCPWSWPWPRVVGRPGQRSWPHKGTLQDPNLTANIQIWIGSHIQPTTDLSWSEEPFTITHSITFVTRNHFKGVRLDIRQANTHEQRMQTTKQNCQNCSGISLSLSLYGSGICTAVFLKVIELSNFNFAQCLFELAE